MLSGVDLVIDYEAAESPSRQIAAWIRRRIESGELLPGQRLPTERQMMQETGVAATTTRRAYRLLAAEGLVVTTPGRGTHVKAR
jgi:DNA-binding GntR family transcriptional regulator